MRRGIGCSMASIPGAQFSITGTTGSAGSLTPKSGWFAYVFPRGAWADQDSTGTLITFGSSAQASRFAANDWIQVGTAVANIRQVLAVGGNSLSVSGAAVTVTEDNRVFLIGQTQPTTNGGSTTYTIPATVVRHRDDDASDRYTNSLITSSADGLIQFYATLGIYDVLIQDGNRSPQGYIADLALGVAEGLSTSLVSVFGATVTVNAAFGVTGWATFGQTATFNAAIGVTGTAVFGATLTANAAIGVTGWATFGSTVTMNAALGVTGTGVFGATLTTSGITNTLDISTTRDIYFRRPIAIRGTTLVAGDFALSAGWGTSAVVTIGSDGIAYDTRGSVAVFCNGTGITDNPTITLTFNNGTYGGTRPRVIGVRTNSIAPSTAFWISNQTVTTGLFDFIGLPVAGSTYGLAWIAVG